MSIGTLALLQLSLMVAVNAQKPIDEQLFIRDGERPPSTAAEMANAAVAVVVAKHTGNARLVETLIPGGPTLLSTAHAFELVEIIKYDSLLPPFGKPFDIIVPGGDKELPTRILRSKMAETEAINRHGTYVIFLRWNEVANKMELAWDHAGLQEVTTNTVRSASRSHSRHSGKTKDAFLEELRASQ
jgi:hypothetical protein